MTDHTNFLNIINNSEAAQKRLAGLSERVISDARDWGLPLRPMIASTSAR
jgi:hypothetical protein